MDFVKYKKKKYKVDNGILNLVQREIESIDQLKGLEELFNLEGLSLSFNYITEIKQPK